MLHRRSVLSTIAVILVSWSGCVDSTPNRKNQSTIIDIEPTSYTKNGVDGTKSSLGYVKYIEDLENDTVTVEQSIVIPGNPCQTVLMDVSPNNGETNGEAIQISVQMDEGDPETACTSVLPTDYPRPTSVTIEFESLTAGQTIITEFDEVEVTVSYTTVGEDNTVTREPIEVSDEIRI